jgi:hypothetical protein
MSTPKIDTQPTVSPTAWDDDLIHLVCCDEYLALCGADLTHVGWVDDEEPVCPLCVLADDDTCPRCGS